MSKNTDIGKVIATERDPSTVDLFSFWTDSDEILKPFDVIKVKHVGNSTTYGLVQQIHHMTDANSSMTGYVSNDFGKLDIDLNTDRLSMNKVMAKVLFNDQGYELPVKENSTVSRCDKDDIQKALGLDEIHESKRIPCGVYEAYEGENKIKVPVYLNSDFLIGPDGAHINISGISGLATKTSYATFLMKAIQEYSIRNEDKVSFVMLNVKQNDLLTIDEKTTKEINHNIYDELGLSKEPFKNVKYYYPYERNKNGSYLDKDKIGEQLKAKKAFFYKFLYEQDYKSVDSIFATIDDPQHTMESINSYVGQKSGPFAGATHWDQVQKTLEEILQDPSKNPSNKEIMIQSWRKYKRHFNNATKNDVFGKKLDATNYEVRLTESLSNIKPNEVHVVDIAKLDESTQGFVFSQVMEVVSNVLLRNEINNSNPPNKIVVFVDELNKYGGKDAPKNSIILRQLLELTERGRSLGAILFSVQQFKSAIHNRITGNCSTSAYGRTSSIEVSQQNYRHMPDVFRNMLIRIKQGTYLLEHPLFKSTMKVTFPEPIYNKQENY